MQESRLPIPNFDRLVGRWTMTGDIGGQIHYRWAPSNHFLLQEVELVYNGRTITGLEVIGRVQKLGETPSSEWRSRFYSFGDGLTIDYIYELEGDELRVWFEDKSQNNFLKAKLDPQNQSFEGAWTWPGGGYSFRATRVED